MQLTSRRALMCAVALVALGACAQHARSSSAEDAAGPAVSGTIAYRERVALPPDAIAEVSLIDATVQDDAARVVATTTVRADGREVPLPFSLRYDAGKIVKTDLYTVRASIKSGGELLFATDIARPVITQDNPTSVDLILARVDPTQAAESGDLAGSSWILVDLNGAGVVADTRVTLDFARNGRATGTGSCNRYFATVDISGSSIRFGAVGATRMACAATAASMQEVKYFGALEGASRFTLEGGVLSIYGSGANRPLRFRRASP
jgi:putative lipoprotein